MGRIVIDVEGAEVKWQLDPETWCEDIRKAATAMKWLDLGAFLSSTAGGGQDVMWSLYETLTKSYEDAGLAMDLELLSWEAARPHKCRVGKCRARFKTERGRDRHETGKFHRGEKVA